MQRRNEELRRALQARNRLLARKGSSVWKITFQRIRSFLSPQAWRERRGSPRGRFGPYISAPRRNPDLLQCLTMDCSHRTAPQSKSGSPVANVHRDLAGLQPSRIHLPAHPRFAPLRPARTLPPAPPPLTGAFNASRYGPAALPHTGGIIGPAPPVRLRVSQSDPLPAGAAHQQGSSHTSFWTVCYFESCLASVMRNCQGLRSTPSEQGYPGCALPAQSRCAYSTKAFVELCESTAGS